MGVVDTYPFVNFTGWEIEVLDEFDNCDILTSFVNPGRSQDEGMQNIEDFLHNLADSLYSWKYKKMSAIRKLPNGGEYLAVR